MLRSTFILVSLLLSLACPTGQAETDVPLDKEGSTWYTGGVYGHTAIDTIRGRGDSVYYQKAATWSDTVVSVPMPNILGIPP